MNFEHYSPTKIIFGTGKLKKLAEFLPSHLKRVLIVTGKRSSKENGSLSSLQTSLRKLNRLYFLFDGVEQNPSTQTVDKGTYVARKEKVDAVIGLGGGSPMDVAKCIALLTNNAGKIEDYIGGKEPQNTPVPIIEIPTTAGTGSEVTQYAVLTNPKSYTKAGYSNSYLFPSIAILDPELTISMPYKVTVNTGIDALTHAIEGYLSTQATPISDTLALESIKIIKEYLPKVAVNGKDIMARTHMLYGSMVAGLVIAQTKTIILHALGYPLTTFYNIPHGRANGALLPYVLEFLKDVQDKKISKIIEMFGGKDLDIIKSFVNELGISIHLSDYGITQDGIPGFVKDVKGRVNLKVTPKKVLQEDISNLYKQAL